VVTSCDEPCVVVGELFVPRSLARRLGLIAQARDVRVARGSARLSAAGSRAVKLRFTRKAKRRLRRQRRIVLSLRVTATDASGNKRITRRRITLRR
jgi:hypothetical protein